MAEVMSDWQPCERPARSTTFGQYVDIVPLSVSEHAQQLFDASNVTDSDAKFTWLAEMPPTGFDGFKEWVATVAASEDPIFYAVIDKASGKVAGR